MVKGYEKLSPAAKKLFDQFLQNYDYYKPIEVKETRTYLKVIFKDMWLHVTGPFTWY